MKFYEYKLFSCKTTAWKYKSNFFFIRIDQINIYENIWTKTNRVPMTFGRYCAAINTTGLKHIDNTHPFIVDYTCTLRTNS